MANGNEPQISTTEKIKRRNLFHAMSLLMQGDENQVVVGGVLYTRDELPISKLN